LETRPALAHDRVGGCLHRQAGLQGGHARQVGGVGALLGLAHDDLVHFARLYPGPRDGFLYDELGKILGLHVFEPSAQPTYRRSHGTDDDDFFHETFSCRFVTSPARPAVD